MASKDFRLLIGKMQEPKRFTSRKLKIEKPKLPPRKKSEHSKTLSGKLEKATQAAKESIKRKVDGASGAIFAVEISKDSMIKYSSLENKKENIRVVGEIDEANIVLIDAPASELKTLKKKIDAYGAPISQERKSKNPPNQDLIAPIENISVASTIQLQGPVIRKLKPSFEKSEKVWFEISCRGGKRVELEETNNSRSQINTAARKLKLTKHDVPEYLLPERIVFFLHCTHENIIDVIGITDCVYEYDFIPPQIVNWLLSENIAPQQKNPIPCKTPPKSAPSIVVLDSGINSLHPSLKNAVAFEASVHPDDASPVDVDGHGTLMAGAALFGTDLSVLLNQKEIETKSWIESVRIYKDGSPTSSSRANLATWAIMTDDAIKLSETKGRKVKQKVFSLAVTCEMPVPGVPTTWSMAVDQLAYNEGKGRLICVSNGNLLPKNKDLANNWPQENLIKKLDDPAQAFNALTVSGYTEFDQFPPDSSFENYRTVAKNGESSPHCKSGNVNGIDLSIKPEVVFEAGNCGFDGHMVTEDISTLTSISTSHDLSRPYDGFWGTSLASALASKFISELWSQYPDLTCEAVRALVVHSADWTKSMLKQFPTKEDRLAICGYGLPNFEFASSCAKERATVIIQDVIPNGMRVQKEYLSKGKPSKRWVSERVLKYFHLPLPEEELLQLGEKEVELRITLSYFAEPNSMGGKRFRGMDLIWDMQGPTESEPEFLKRINQSMRNKEEPKTKGFDNWQIGVLKRRKGTVQGDRWRGPASLLAGDKIIAVYPKYGWWNERKELMENETPFSLVISVVAPGTEIYNYVEQNINIEHEIYVEIDT